MITYEEVSYWLDYNPETGFFYWKHSRQGTRAGTRAGCVKSRGYRSIGINGKHYKEHRLAWLLSYGEWPSLDVDHIDNIKVNNSIINLRLATESQNLANQKKRSSNTTGYKGVSVDKRIGRYKAAITKNRKCYHLGYFGTAEEAFEAYKKAAINMFGDFANF